MNVSEDGTVTGSVDASQLDQLEPKTDEARAQIDALKRDHQFGRDEANAAAARLSEQAVAQNPGLAEAPQDNRDVQGKVVAPDQPEAQQSSAPVDETDSTTDAPAGEEDVEQLRAEAEALGVKVDRRWGADRLRAEVDAARQG